MNYYCLSRSNKFSVGMNEGVDSSEEDVNRAQMERSRDKKIRFRETTLKYLVDGPDEVEEDSTPE